MRSIWVLMEVVLFLILPAICIAEENPLAQENQDLKLRVERLENEVEELKKLVTQQAEIQKTQASQISQQAQAGTAQGSSVQLSQEDLNKIMAMVQKDMKDKKPVWSSLDIQIYGFIKADASYDTSRTSPGNYVKWVDSEKSNDNDNEFNLTANETRLGVIITGPQDKELKASGKLEIDFYGGATVNDENKAKLQLRHGFLNLEWPDDRFQILAGQTSDVVSPLAPYTLNYTVMWFAGNIGYRRPQIRLTKSYDLGGNIDMKLEGAIARTIGDLSPLASESGEDAGYPTIQGRASFTFPWFGPDPTTVGISGHIGREEYDISANGANKKFETWSINLDLIQPINKWLAIKGEVFTGENLDAYLGGIGQGVNTTSLKEISSKGGWVAASFGPFDKYTFNFGAGMDDPSDSDLKNDDRSLNRNIFGNVIYSFNKNAQVGFELSHWRTEYKGHGSAESIRGQTSFIYKF